MLVIHLYMNNVNNPTTYFWSRVNIISGYINEAGELNLERFEIFMQELAKIDKEMFQETFVDLQYFEAKTGRRPNANERKEVSILLIINYLTTSLAWRTIDSIPKSEREMYNNEPKV